MPSQGDILLSDIISFLSAQSVIVINPIRKLLWVAINSQWWTEDCVDYADWRGVWMEQQDKVVNKVIPSVCKQQDKVVNKLTPLLCAWDHN